MHNTLQSGDESAEDDGDEDQARSQDQDHIYASVLRILEVLKEEKLSMAEFLDAYSWGNPGCITDDQICQSRTHFLQSRLFPVLLKRWPRPPCQRKSKKKRPSGAQAPLNAFAMETMQELAGAELDAVECLVKSMNNCLTKADLIQVHLDQLHSDMKASAPMLWGFLEGIATSNVQWKHGTHKDNCRGTRSTCT